MGGKNAIIVDDDADLDEAVHGVVASAFGYQGQKCSACSRVIVPEALHDAFLARLVEATRSLKVGAGRGSRLRRRPGHRRGSLPRAFCAAIEQGKGEGRLAYAGDVGGAGATRATSSRRTSSPTWRRRRFLAQEEIFGPVLAVLRLPRPRRTPWRSPTARRTP